MGSALSYSVGHGYGPAKLWTCRTLLRRTDESDPSRVGGAPRGIRITLSEARGGFTLGEGLVETVLNYLIDVAKMKNVTEFKVEALLSIAHEVGTVTPTGRRTIRDLWSIL